MYHIISNPISGRNKKKNKKNTSVIVKNYLDEHKIDYIWHDSQFFQHPKQLAHEISTSEESGSIIVIGGDGTLNEVINGIENLSNWNIGLIPSGSGNDFATNIGLNKKRPLEAIKRIVEGKAKPTDYIQVNDIRCVNVVGTGIDVLVLEKFEKYVKLKGKFRYFIALVSALMHFNWYEFDVSIDNQGFVHKTGFLTCVCNGSSIGGGIPICPTAKVADQKLEFVFVNKIPKPLIVWYLIRLMAGKVLKFKATEHIYCEKIVFKNEKDFVMQIDGNIDNATNQYTCEIVKNGINLYR